MQDHEHPLRAKSSDDLLQQWVEQTLPRALAYARSVCRNAHLAEDVVQDCYARLLRHRERYDLLSDGWKLLLRSITHACIDVHRRARNALPTDPGQLDLYRSSEATAGGLDPKHQAEANELHTAIGAALSELPVAQRTALELKSLGCSMAEIGETLEVSENHAAVLVHRARKAMAKELAPFLAESAQVGSEARRASE